MKTKLSPLYFVSCILCLLALRPSPSALGQIPQGFNYQAVARDGTGNPITDPIDVKIAILSDDSPETVLWEEMHSPVDPNDQGLFSIVVGTGAWESGVPEFSDIDWSVSPLYIRTSIYYGDEWKNLGSAQLWSVPYSMIAGDLEGVVENLEIMGEDITSDEALFEVKRKDGEVMFGVYNHGVRINMPLDTLSKTRKGGFIVAGFDNIKGIVQDYLVVNPDSIRAYIDTNPGKTRKGGFAVGGFGTVKAPGEEYLRVTRDSTRVYLNDTGTKTRKGGFAVGGFGTAKQDIDDYLLVSPDSVRIFLKETDETKTRKGGFAITGYDPNTKGLTKDYLNVDIDTNSIVDPSENRILWYPLKNAFLTGKVLIEDRDSVGENSFASGYESKAIGKYSQALGYQARARKDYSTAIGYQAVANEINSFAFGQWATAKNDESYALGRGAIAEGFRSFAFGSAGIDSLNQTTGVAYAKGDYSFAIGQGSQALGKGSVAIGIADTAKGNYSTALGYKTSSSATYAFSMGYKTVVSGGGGSFAIGRLDTASGWCSGAIGYMTKATGSRSLAMGEYTIASGLGSFASGHLTSAEGEYSTAMGGETKALAGSSCALGWATTASGWVATSMGYQTKAKGTRSLATGDNTVASGEFSSSFGLFTIAKPFSSVVIGTYNDTTICYNQTGWDSRDPLFIVGNGSDNSSRSNALTILKSGNVGIGDTSPTYKVDIAIPGLGTSMGDKVNMQRFSGSSANQDKLKITHNRFAAGNDWTSAEFRIQKTVDASDFGYLTFKADYMEIGIGTTPQLTITNSGIKIGSASGFLTANSWEFGIDNSSGSNIDFHANSSSTDFSARIYRNGGNNGNFDFVNTGTGVFNFFNGTTIGSYTTSGWQHSSDIRLKENISVISNVLTDIVRLQSIKFNFKTDPEKRQQAGLIAQDVEKVFPELVSTDENGFKSIYYDQVSVLLVEAIKEQQQLIESQNEKIARLEKLVEELLER